MNLMISSYTIHSVRFIPILVTISNLRRAKSHFLFFVKPSVSPMKTPIFTHQIYGMSASRIVLFVVLGFLLLAVFNGCSTYNSFVSKDESINGQWKQVEVRYQERMDKTKNLFEIVLAGADYEKQTLKEIIEARTNATKITLSVENLSEENIKKFQEVQDQFSSSLGRLLAISENYPQLRATDAFRDFQAQYENMENMISVERRRFNLLCEEYNKSIRRFPTNIWAGVFGFEKRAYFSSSPGSENAPDIKKMRQDNL
jgi:LemA protein